MLKVMRRTLFHVHSFTKKNAKRVQKEMRRTKKKKKKKKHKSERLNALNAHISLKKGRDNSLMYSDVSIRFER